MADVVRTCANCGNTQTTGDFCEKCGTRMPAASAAPAAAPAAAAYAAARPSTPPPTTPPPYGTQPPYGAVPPVGAPQYAYEPKREGWGRLFDMSFKGFATPSTLKSVYLVVVLLIGLFLVFSIIYGAIYAGKADAGLGVMWIFMGLFSSAVLFFVNRLLFELITTVNDIRDRGGR